MSLPSQPIARRRRRRQVLRGLIVLGLVGLLAAGSAVWTNAFGVGERFENLRDRIELALDPPPDRPIRDQVEVTPEPDPTATPTPGPTQPGTTALPGPTPTPRPVRRPVDVSILEGDPERYFISQQTKDWCAPAGIQMTLAVLGLADTTPAFQRRLAARVEEWESWQDSHNGGWGPSAIADALEAYGAQGYQIRAYGNRTLALRDSAAALTRTGKPVILIAWRGAHTWVMTGYRADADPTIFRDALVTGTYILDPWYPRISSIWGPSDPAGTFQDAAEMRRNYLAWKRPEGAYPGRDGKYLAIVPTIPRQAAAP
ncbi:MAG TPA: papain-like cysteine protease family protein [Candidatus Limnocylindrales bacterium]|nr:papain-like cysteine protease family protein [Candidatus Limnocylindrales bacterium]